MFQIFRNLPVELYLSVFAGGFPDFFPSRMEPSLVDQVVEVCGCSREAAARAVEAAGDGGIELAVEFVLSSMSTVPPYRDDMVDAPQKLVCLVRADLGMSAGKIAAQVGHAVLGGVRVVANKPGGQDSLRKWEEHGEAIIVLQVKDLEELETLLGNAAALQLPICKISDAGRTEVAAGSVTVGSIGPTLVGAIDSITGHLSLLQ